MAERQGSQDAQGARGAQELIEPRALAPEQARQLTNPIRCRGKRKLIHDTQIPR